MSSIWTIRRSATDVKLTGLCGGVARYLGIDPTLIRVGVALLALSGGIGLVLYLAGWLLIPVEGSERSQIDDLLGSQAPRWSKEIWIAIVVVACIIAFAIFGALTPFGVGPALILAGIWYFGFYKDRKPRQTSAAPPDVQSGSHTSRYEFISHSGTPSPFTEAARAWRQRIEENARKESEQATWPSPPPGNVDQRPAANPDHLPSADEVELQQRQEFFADPDPVGIYSAPSQVVSSAPGATPRRADSRSAKALRLVCLSAVVLTLGGLGLADYLGAGLPHPLYLAAALLLVGATLIAAAWLGRARGLVPLGFFLLIGLMTTFAVQTAGQHGPWARTMQSYTTVAQLPPGGDTREFGQLTTDLSKLSLTGDATYRASVDLGTLTVVVPPEAQVRVNYAIDSGAVEVFDTVVAGGNELRDSYEPEPVRAGAPVLTLDLSADMGKVVVRR